MRTLARFYGQLPCVAAKKESQVCVAGGAIEYDARRRIRGVSQGLEVKIESYQMWHGEKTKHRKG